jgi:uroporphyrinogen-III synthase
LPPKPDAVLVTRPEPGAAETVARLDTLGFASVLAPFLRIRILSPRLPEPASVQAVVVTSANALPAIPITYRNVPLLAVGDATAARARQAGFTGVTSASGDAEALASLIAEVCDPVRGPLLQLAGRGQGGKLAADLRRSGFRVLRRCVYVSTAVARFPEAAAEAIAEGRVRAALFFSAETARAFVRCLPPALAPRLADMVALAIGPAAASVLQSLPWRHVRAAARPTQDDLLALL